MTIRNKILFWFLMPSILIAAITAVFCYLYTQGTVRQNIFDQLEIAADELKDRVHVFLEGKKGRTADFGSDAFIRDCTEEIVLKEMKKKYTSVLSNHLRSNKKSIDPAILEILIVDLNGRVIASTEENKIDEDVSSEEYFIKAEYLKSFAGEPRYNAYLNEIVIDFSTVLLSKIGRESIGIIVNRIRFGSGISVLQESEWNYFRIIDINKTRIIDFSSDGFIRDRTEDIVRRDDRVQYYTDRLNIHLIKNKMPLDPDILAVFVVDIAGKLIGSTEIGMLGKIVLNKTFFSKTLKTGICIGDLQYSREDKQNTYFDVGRSIFSREEVNPTGGPIGVIINRYTGGSLIKVTRSEMSELNKDPQLKGFGETGEVYIVNKDKLMITESRFGKDTIFKQIVDTEGVRVAFENGTGTTGIYPNYRGTPVLGVSRYIERMDWVVLAEKDVSEAFAPVIRLRNLVIIIAIMGVTVIVVIAIFLSRGISRPIQRLVKGTKQVSEGDLAFKIETKEKGEIGYLARSFNEMTHKLGESKKQLNDYTDNLEKKVVEKIGEIIKRKEYTDNLIETAQDAIVCINEKGFINVWNSSAGNLFGYSKEEIIGLPVTKIIPEKYKMEHLEGMKRFLKTHKPEIIGKVIEVSGMTKKGVEVPVELSISFQEIEASRYSFTAIIRDITEKKKAEEERKRILDELRYKNDELEQIIYTTSHDLRSPLVNIMGFSRELENAFKEARSILDDGSLSSVLENKLTPVLDEDIPEALKFILTSTTKMDSLLNGLLRIARMGRVKLNIKQLDMDKLMSDVVANFEHKIKELGIAIKVDYLPSCNGDEEQINQVFSNLMDNALKYHDPDRSGVIRISGTKQLVYCIEDNGVGIKPEYHSKIYEIFHRLNPGGVKGEGLGLTIVRRIVDRHGGRIWCESKPGKGSKFYVAMPK